VALDVKRGLVSEDGARRYGVVLNSNRSVNESATNDLRRKMASERGDIALFNFGGTVEELKARCKSDTSLDPPVTPVFQKWMGQSGKGAAA
jgi:N-methylhydantoinase B